MKDKTLYLIRGCSGSGKSSFAETLHNAVGGLHLEADAYLYEGGIYNWSEEKLSGAHSAVLCNTRMAMRNGDGPIIISDTNVKASYLKFYLNLADLYHYKVVSLVVEHRHKGKNSHGVSKEKLKSQAEALKASLVLSTFEGDDNE